MAEVVDVIVYDYAVSGWPADVEACLARKIGALSRWRAFHQKVGITNNPPVRWRQKYRLEGWSHRVVFYASSSRRHVQDLERWAIDRFRAGQVRSPGYFHNEAPGGEGRHGDGFQYLYVVCAPKYARLG